MSTRRKHFFGTPFQGTYLDTFKSGWPDGGSKSRRSLGMVTSRL